MKPKPVITLFLVFCFLLTCCTGSNGSSPFAVIPSITDADLALERLQEGNDFYVNKGENPADLSEAIRKKTTDEGQFPYAAVITCSDSRLPVEHIFSAGIGELFVIRTAGNVLDDMALGSVEYGAEHLKTPLIVVLGHTSCGAVAATIEGRAHGHIADITSEIKSAIGSEADARKAEVLNVKNTMKKIEQDDTVSKLIEKGKVDILGAIYDIERGKVTYLR